MAGRGSRPAYLSPLAVELEPVVVLVVAGALAGSHGGKAVDVHAELVERSRGSGRAERAGRGLLASRRGGARQRPRPCGRGSGRARARVFHVVGRSGRAV